MNDGRDSAATIARLSKLLADRVPLAQASKSLGLSLDAAWKLAARHNLPRRRRMIEAAKRKRVIKAIESEQHTGADIARRYEIAKSTVSRLKNFYSRQTYGTRRVAVQRCPNGHRITVLPCQTCRANGDL